MEKYLKAMIICPNGHLKYVEMEGDDYVCVQEGNDLITYKKDEVIIMKEFNKKIQDFFDDLWYNICNIFWFTPKEWYYAFYNFCCNVKLFWNDLWEYRPWDSEYCTKIFATALDGLRECLMTGNEVEVTRMKKVAAIEELIYLLNNDPEDNEELRRAFLGNDDDFFFESSKKTATEKKLHRNALLRYMDQLDKVNEMRLNRIFEIIRGQSDEELDISKDIKTLKKGKQVLAKQYEEDGYQKFYEARFDGTGYAGWWD